MGGYPIKVFWPTWLFTRFSMSHQHSSWECPWSRERKSLSSKKLLEAMDIRINKHQMLFGNQILYKGQTSKCVVVFFLNLLRIAGESLLDHVDQLQPANTYGEEALDFSGDGNLKDFKLGWHTTIRVTNIRFLDPSWWRGKSLHLLYIVMVNCSFNIVRKCILQR